MTIDLKQIIAAFLTLGVFAMLLNIMRNGPFLDPVGTSSEEKYSNGSEMPQIEERSEIDNAKLEEIWGSPSPPLKPCWDQHITNLKGKPWGFVGVRISNGPHYHHIQIADAVLVSKYLGATLVVPNIKDGDKEPVSQFDRIYDVNNFITSLQNIVRVVGRLPDDMTSVVATIINVPYRVTPEYIDEHIRPIFNQKIVIILDNFFFNTASKGKDNVNMETEALRCLVMYKALQFNSQLVKLGNRIVNRMREAAEASKGHFIAVDIPINLLEKKGCTNRSSAHTEPKAKKCSSAFEVGNFLKRIGFPAFTAIYLTQSRWDKELEPLQAIYPNLYTKEYSMPFNEERQILYSGKSQYEKAVDFYICSQSDVFVPSISGMFYSTVSGVRISSGKTQILVPNSNNDSPSEIKIKKNIARYVTKKDHPVYKCFC